MEFKNLVINENEKLCYIDNNPVNLTRSEYNLLLFFLSNKNKVFSRKELIDNAWEVQVKDKAVDTAISRLRKKLGEYGKNIVSRIGFGYAFMV